MEKTAPLTGGFLIIAIVGFFISLFLVYNKGYHSWGISFMIVFVAMFLASFVSLNKLEIESIMKLEHLKKL